MGGREGLGDVQDASQEPLDGAGATARLGGGEQGWRSAQQAGEGVDADLQTVVVVEVVMGEGEVGDDAQVLADLAGERVGEGADASPVDLAAGERAQLVELLAQVVIAVVGGDG